MPRLTYNTSNLFIFIAFTLLALASSGCQGFRQNRTEPDALPIETGKILVLGFMQAMPQTGERGIIQSPISGASFMAEPVSPAIADNLTDILFSRMLGLEKYDLISADQAKGILFNTIASHQGMRDLEIFQRTGQAFSADAVMAGYIYRWQEREGTGYSASRPASVAFELYMIRSSDGKILWKGRFDKTQKGLSENIFDIKTFMKGKGRWMTAEELAELGLDNIFGMPESDEPE